MPKGIDWFHFVYVNLGFIAMVLAMYFFIALNDIKKNWPKYRCNPLYMPLSDNVEQDFVYCIQNMQTNFMGYLLEPLTYIMGSLSSIGDELTSELNFARNMISNIRGFLANIVDGIFGVFVNIITEFQKIIIGITDLIGKLIGIVVTMMYVMDGSVKTMQSAWNGPPGQMVQVMGACFHPETPIKKQDGTVVCMKDLNLGDILENGSKVKAVMKIDNPNNQHSLYKIPWKGVSGNDIYVTGSHMVMNSNKEFIKVKDYIWSIAQKEVTSSWFSCLITDNHIIQVGEHVFWDWEDYLLKR